MPGVSRVPEQRRVNRIDRQRVSLRNEKTNDFFLSLSLFHTIDYFSKKLKLSVRASLQGGESRSRRLQ